MKFISILLFFFAFSFTAAGQQLVSPKTKMEISPPKKIVEKSKPLPADDKDPVCLMKVKKGSLLTTLYKGKLYGFCSEYCKNVFLADPAAQLK